MPRHINLENIHNFRDLGGYESIHGETSFSILYRSGSLAYATDNDLNKLKKLGIRSILDLRNHEDIINHHDPIGIIDASNYKHIEVNGKGRIAKDEQDMIRSYMEMVEDEKTALEIFKTILCYPKPLVYHCNAGKDRTGCITMILLLANGVSFDDINADYYLSLPHLNGLVAKTLEKFPDFPHDVLYPSTFFLKKVHDAFIKEYGSVENYFKKIGFSDNEFKKLSRILCKT